MLDRPNDSLSARDIAYHMHPFTNARRLESEGPFVITRGNGIHIYDEQGRDYIDALAGLWCASLGFSEKRLAEAAYKQMLELPYASTFGQRSHPTVIELAEKLISLMPVRMSKVFFNNSGSEANDSAAKLVWYYNNAIGRPRKKKIIGRMKGYHGITVASGSLCGLPYVHKDFDLPIPNVRHTDCPHYWRYGKPGESEEDFASRMAENLDALIEREGPDTVAAFIAEPVQGAGGVVIPPRTYFAKIQEVLRKHDVLFIADEVICGFGRTGNMFGCETFAIEPDILTCAKALSSSYLPISATVINEKLYQGIATQSDANGSFIHGFTYSGHPVCAAVALETLNIYEERDIVGHVRNISPRFLAGVRRFADHPLVGEVRGDRPDGGHRAGARQGDQAAVRCQGRRGSLFRGAGAGVRADHAWPWRAVGDGPPLIITEAEIDDMLGRLERALDETGSVRRLAPVTRNPLPRSLYAETARPAVATPPLDGDRRVDVCVIGGGFTGLSAALHLAQQGVDVAVLEAHEPGWGASGRNGGQVNPGLKHDPDQVEADFGADLGRRMVALSGDAPNVVFRLIERHQIECDALQSGTLRAAFGVRDSAGIRASAEQWIRRDAPVELLESDAAREVTDTDRYVCAMLDRRGGQVNPLGYARGLAQAAMQAGASVHGATPALEVKRNGIWDVRTPTGTVRADKLVLATNGYTDDRVAGTAPQHRAGVQRDRGERTVAAGADEVGAVRDGARHGLLPVRSRQPSADGRPQRAARHQRAARAAIPDRLCRTPVAGGARGALDACVEWAIGDHARPLSARARAGRIGVGLSRL